tara:strand:- start:2101 stop:2352 length:252 start_codon:yes stop_codon:yes gene_type:complete
MCLKKLRWKCRKGIRELDILLQDFLDKEFNDLDNHNKRLFEEVLEIETYDLLNAITGKSSYNIKYENIIEKLSNLSKLKDVKK